MLKANGGKYCLDDPAYSTRNGTQLIVYTCHDGANQRLASATSLAGPPGSARSTSRTCTEPSPASLSSSGEDLRAPAMTRTVSLQPVLLNR